MLKEKGWNSFAEYAFDVSNLLSKPTNPAVSPDDIDVLDEEELIGKRMPADVYEDSLVYTLEEEGLGHLVPKFKQDMQEYRKAVKAIVRLWPERGLL